MPFAEALDGQTATPSTAGKQLCEKSGSKPQNSQGNLLLIGNENLDCFLVGGVAIFPILLVYWFGVLFSSWASSQEIQTGEAL